MIDVDVCIFKSWTNSLSVIVEKSTDYNYTTLHNETSHWCFLGVVPRFHFCSSLTDQSQNQTVGIESNDPKSIVAYLAYRKWRSSGFFNIALLLLAALIAQVATNFLSGKPGIGGIRVLFPHINQVNYCS